MFCHPLFHYFSWCFRFLPWYCFSIGIEIFRQVSVSNSRYRDNTIPYHPILRSTRWRTYQQWCPGPQPSACPLSASPCWCRRPQHRSPAAPRLPPPPWTSICPRCLATTASAWSAPLAAAASPAGSGRSPGTERKCLLGYEKLRQ